MNLLLYLYLAFLAHQLTYSHFLFYYNNLISVQTSLDVTSCLIVLFYVTNKVVVDPRLGITTSFGL